MRAEHYFHRGLTSTTHRTYSSAQRQYLMFCDTHNLTALPGDENTILLFITDLAKILVVAHQINRINLVVFLVNCVPKNCTQYYMAMKCLVLKSFLFSPPYLLCLKFVGKLVALSPCFHAYVVSVYKIDKGSYSTEIILHI